MESSPILIIRMPNHKTEDEVSNVFMDFEESPIRDEYHIMVIKDYVEGSKEIRFEVLNSNHSVVEFEELKNTLLKEMEKAQLHRQKNTAK
jgi:hypothetical protein